MKIIFGILGAVAAVLYWRYGVYAQPLSLAENWASVGRLVIWYAAAGFVVGSVVGFAINKIGSDY